MATTPDPYELEAQDTPLADATPIGSLTVEERLARLEEMTGMDATLMGVVEGTERVVRQ